MSEHQNGKSGGQAMKVILSALLAVMGAVTLYMSQITLDSREKLIRLESQHIADVWRISDLEEWKKDANKSITELRTEDWKAREELDAFRTRLVLLERLKP